MTITSVSLIDYIAVSGTMDKNVLEFVDHLHEHFTNPCSINSNGRYNVPNNLDEGYRYLSRSNFETGTDIFYIASRCVNLVYGGTNGPVGHIG